MQSLKTIPQTSGTILTGLFKDYQDAEWAYQDLLSRGYRKEDIHLFMSDEARKKCFPENETETHLSTKALQGIGAGGSIGGALGAIAAAIIAVGTSLTIPALGVVISGPLAASLAGAGAGGLTGGIVGALVGIGIPDEKAKIYESNLKAGGIVIGVDPHSQEEIKDIEAKWKEHRAETVFVAQ